MRQYPVLAALTLLAAFAVGCYPHFLRDNRTRTCQDLAEHFRARGLPVDTIELGNGAHGLAGCPEGAMIAVAGKKIHIGKYDLNDSAQRKLRGDLERDGHVSFLGVKSPARLNGSFV